MSALVLYSRLGCHLCEQAEEALDTLGLAFRRVEVGGDADLEARYGWDVPVLVRGEGASEEVLAKGVISRARLLRLRVQDQG